jgi:hypothetical protein
MDAQSRVQHLQVWNSNENYISDLNFLPPNLRTLIRRNHSQDYPSDDNPPKKWKSKQPKIRVSLKLKPPPIQSSKHETFQKLSKLFIKPSALNSTTNLNQIIKDRAFHMFPLKIWAPYSDKTADRWREKILWRKKDVSPSKLHRGIINFVKHWEAHQTLCC